MIVITNTTANDVPIPPQIKLAPGQEIEIPDSVDAGFIIKAIADRKLSIRERPSQVKFNFAAGISVTYSAANTVTPAIDSTQVMLMATTDCWINVDDTNANAPVATIGATSIFLATNEKFFMSIARGKKIAVVRVSVSGTLYVMPLS